MRPTRRHAARAISLGFAAALLAGAAMAEPVYRHTLTNPLRVNAAVVEEPEVPEEPVAKIGLPASVTVLPQESECTDVPVQSNGALDVTGMSASLSGTDASRFSLCTPSEQACGAELAVGESCNLGVRLDETAIGVYGALLTVIASGGVTAEAPGSIFGIGHRDYTGPGGNKYVWTSMSDDNDWRAISAGQSFGYALKTDGSVWGTGKGGQAIGGVETKEWVRIGLETGFVATSAGGNFGHFLKSDGTVWGIGGDGNGQLGGTGTQSHLVRVGSEGGFIAISAGFAHGYALKSDGTVWGIGRNDSYQTGGIYTHVNKTEWTRIGSETGFISVVSGSSHGYALKSDGTVWGIGNNQFGQIGGSGHRSDWARVGTLTGVVSIGSGTGFGYAITSDGAIWGIGNNGVGQLGGNSRNYWAKVGTETGFTQVVGGNGFAHALKADGTVWGIGGDNIGQIGGTTRSYWAPISTAAGTHTVFRSLAAGTSHAYALK